MQTSDSRKRAAERAATTQDTCQTPGCGHAKSLHHNSMGACVRVNPRCGCTRYTSPTETVCGCERNPYNGDVRCHFDGEFVNVKCWKCGTHRGGGVCPNPVPAPTETVSEPCPNHGCHDWRCESCKHPAREQVLADAEAAYRADYDTCEVEDAEHRTMHRAFIAGYLAGKGITE